MVIHLLHPHLTLHRARRGIHQKYTLLQQRKQALQWRFFFFFSPVGSLLDKVDQSLTSSQTRPKLFFNPENNG